MLQRIREILGYESWDGEIWTRTYIFERGRVFEPVWVYGKFQFILN